MKEIITEIARISCALALALIGFFLCFVALFYGMAGYIWTPFALMALAFVTLSTISDVMGV